MSDEDRLAIVGSVRFVDADGERLARARIGEELARRRPDMVISGGAVGVDTWAAQIAQQWQIPVRELLPDNPRWEPDGFKQRNRRVAWKCTRLLRIHCRWSRTFGSGYTLNQARRWGRPTLAVQIPAAGVLTGVLLVPDTRGGQLHVDVENGLVLPGSPAVRTLGWVGQDADELIALLVRKGRQVSWRSGPWREGGDDDVSGAA